MKIWTVLRINSLKQKDSAGLVDDVISIPPDREQLQRNDKDVTN